MNSGKDSLNRPPTAQEIIPGTDNQDSMKLGSFCTETAHRMGESHIHQTSDRAGVEDTVITTNTKPLVLRLANGMMN